MNEQAFFERRRPDWTRLLQLCDKADRSSTDLNPGELRELIRLYRRISTDLALVRTRSTNPSLIGYLNDLAARAYGVVYREPRKPLLKVIAESIAIAAQTVRRRRYFVFASATLFFGAALLAFGLMSLSPAVADYFVPPGMHGVFDDWRVGHFKERTGSESTMMTSFYASNNPRVAIVAGAIGAGSFGFFSVYMVAQNGAMLGELAHELVPVGRVGYLLARISPHGVPELSGIIISGSSGLLLGYALINPGRRTRGDSLKAVGPDAVVLLATSVVMMFIAAPIEGFFSFNPKVPEWVKVTVAVLSLIAWLLFWSNFAKTSAEQSTAPQEELALA